MNLHWSSPAWLWLGLLALPIAAAWFLKLRRPRQEVPALALWRLVLDDQRVNAPFQRLKRQLPLWLALLVLACAVLAAAMPTRRGGAATVDRVAVLIDTSASMGARTTAGGPTRLAEAVTQARALVDGLGRGQQLMLVAAGPSPVRLTGFSDDRRELLAALDGLVPACGGCDLAAAVRLLGAAAKATTFDTAILLSDGNLDPAVDADLPFRLDYRRVAPGGANLGLTTSAARRTADGRWEAAIQIDGSAAAHRGGSVRITSGDTLLMERAVAPGPNGTDRLAVVLPGDAAQDLTVTLVPDAFDALNVDDTAYLHLPALRPLAVRIAPGLAAWQRALAAQPAISLVAQDADLVISDRAADLATPAAVRVLVGGVPTALAGLITVAEGGSAVVDRRSGDPLLAHVDPNDLVITDRVAWSAGADEAAVEARGWRVLIHGDRGPLALTGEDGGDLLLAFTFHTDRSTLPYRLAFPVLAGNLVEQARRRRGQAEAATRATGLTALVGLPRDASLTVTRPDGSTQTVHADGTGTAAGITLPEPGLYRLTHGDAFGAALLDPRETSLAVSDKLHLRDVQVATAPGTSTDQPLWRYLALVALLLLVFDWWYAHRDPRLPGR
jgi:hypothetical protein